ncbi:hypothetical protein L3V59_22280 [Burkholderia aenigmatica]|uniref:hypothetical protein n=1 Tax=Burkholderia aenigmatica TaxID=2015348 RepID=UPI001F42704D|nr:hypothetical protein [Burkholderia aenigmatica]UKD15669.1 hypothetical protein L3V59_22280 [Burkholderia aenigmatica]
MKGLLLLLLGLLAPSLASAAVNVRTPPPRHPTHDVIVQYWGKSGGFVDVYFAAGGLPMRVEFSRTNSPSLPYDAPDYLVLPSHEKKWFSVWEDAKEFDQDRVASDWLERVRFEQYLFNDSIDGIRCEEWRVVDPKFPHRAAALCLSDDGILLRARLDIDAFNPSNSGKEFIFLNGDVNSSSIEAKRVDRVTIPREMLEAPTKYKQRPPKIVP